MAYEESGAPTLERDIPGFTSFFKRIDLRDKSYEDKYSILEGANGGLVLIESEYYGEESYRLGRLNLDPDDKERFFFGMPDGDSNYQVPISVNELESILVEEKK